MSSAEAKERGTYHPQALTNIPKLNPKTVLLYSFFKQKFVILVPSKIVDFCDFLPVAGN